MEVLECFEEEDPAADANSHGGVVDKGGIEAENWVLEIGRVWS